MKFIYSSFHLHLSLVYYQQIYWPYLLPVGFLAQLVRVHTDIRVRIPQSRILFFSAFVYFIALFKGYPSSKYANLYVKCSSPLETFRAETSSAAKSEEKRLFPPAVKVSNFYVTSLYFSKSSKTQERAVQVSERTEKEEIPSPPPASDESPKMISEPFDFFYFM